MEKVPDYLSVPLPIVQRVRAACEDLVPLPAMGDPFYPGWGDGLLAMVLRDDGSTDWSEVEELLADSYRLLAPKKLIARLGDDGPRL